jgi:hypothetical protein
MLMRKELTNTGTVPEHSAKRLQLSAQRQKQTSQTHPVWETLLSPSWDHLFEESHNEMSLLKLQLDLLSF